MMSIISHSYAHSWLAVAGSCGVGYGAILSMIVFADVPKNCMYSIVERSLHPLFRGTAGVHHGTVRLAVLPRRVPHPYPLLPQADAADRTI
jgi:hypothetical protein